MLEMMSSHAECPFVYADADMVSDLTFNIACPSCGLFAGNSLFTIIPLSLTHVQ